MCKGFGLIVDKKLDVYFTMPDIDGDCSHTDTLKALGWKDNTDPFIRDFVRVQYRHWEARLFEFDEDETLPGWVEGNKQEIRDKCNKVLERAYPAYAEFQKAEAQAYAEYQKARATAYAEYQKARATAETEYQKARAQAWDIMRDELAQLPEFVGE